MSQIALCLTVALLASDPQDAPRALEAGEYHLARDQAEPKDRIRPGMTADQVRKSLGLPTRTARQILYRRYLEQWMYNDRPGFWIEFDCHKGDEPRVSTVHLPAPLQ